MALRDLGLSIHYAGRGSDIATRFLLPALSESVRYDRLSSYFTVASLVAVGTGLERVRLKGGRVRLVLGVHDIDPQLVQARRLSDAGQVVARLRERLLEHVTSLADELARDRVEAVAWMMKDGLLEARVALVLANESYESGIFHSKRFVFVDACGDVVTATGSPNETASGLGGNYEEVTVHRSWSDLDGYTAAHHNQFESVWRDEEPALSVIELDPSLGDELLKALRPTPHAASVEEGLPSRGVPASVLSVLCRSPCMAVMNSSDRPLYPHQERVVIEAASRWPIRVVIADEVGLGKTFEAAAVIRYAVQMAGVQRVVVLAPPSLLRQWQDELVASFNLRFWRYDPSSRAYVDPDGAARTAQLGPFGGSYPELSLVSRELARGTRATGHAFENADVFPEMLVLDEAHAVRKRREASGEARDSLLRKVIEDVASRVPHVVFVTATPLQTHAEELFDMLGLLGLPPAFDERAYGRSLQLLCTSPDTPPDLADVVDALSLVSEAGTTYRPRTLAADPVVEALNGDYVGLSTVARTRRALRARRAWPLIHSAMVRFHPAAMLTLRNTRGALEKVGYRFPERHFVSVETEVGDAVSGVLLAMEAYMVNGLASVERALYPERATALGFMISTYRQRVASSLQSALDTLSGRRARIQALLDGGSWSAVEDDEDNLDNAEGPTVERHLTGPLSSSVRRAADIELAQLGYVIEKLEGLQPSVRAADPKMIRAVEELTERLGTGSACLVFSRYTSTVRSLVAAYRDAFGEPAPFAVFTGAGAEVWDGTSMVRGQKRLVTEALSGGVVKVVFCSEAASEGLNLQTASVLINVDVPWNPARLEQRIGRIARLGQTADRVVIVNLWYPGSVEASIYARVLHRKDAMEVALGAFPEIVGGAIRDAVRERYINEGSFQTDVLDKLQTARESVQLEALNRVWSRPGADLLDARGTADMRQRLLEVCSRIALEVGWTVSVSEDAIRFGQDGTETIVSANVDVVRGFTLASSWFNDLIASATVADPGHAPMDLGVLEREGMPLLFALRSVGDRWIRVLRPDAVPEVLAALFLAEPIVIADTVYLEYEEGSQVGFLGESLPGWWPDPRGMVVPTHGQGDMMPAVPGWANDEANVSFRPMGRVPVRGERA